MLRPILTTAGVLVAIGCSRPQVDDTWRAYRFTEQGLVAVTANDEHEVETEDIERALSRFDPMMQKALLNYRFESTLDFNVIGQELAAIEQGIVAEEWRKEMDEREFEDGNIKRRQHEFRMKYDIDYQSQYFEKIRKGHDPNDYFDFEWFVFELF